MAYVTVTFKTDNAAFRDEDGYLNARVAAAAVRNAADAIKGGIRYGPIIDTNGSGVGYFEVREDE
jgi:hypothetical protein